GHRGRRARRAAAQAGAGYPGRRRYSRGAGTGWHGASPRRGHPPPAPPGRTAPRGRTRISAAGRGRRGRRFDTTVSRQSFACSNPWPASVYCVSPGTGQTLPLTPHPPKWPAPPPVGGSTDRRETYPMIQCRHLLAVLGLAWASLMPAQADTRLADTLARAAPNLDRAVLAKAL